MTFSVDTANEVRDALGRITDAWRTGRPEAMAPLLHPNIVMVLPDFSGRLDGRDALVTSFRDFAREARVGDYRQGEVIVDGDGNAAVAQYSFEMVYERDGQNWRSTGWDVWVFTRDRSGWIAVWRTMQGLAEEPTHAPPTV